MTIETSSWCTARSFIFVRAAIVGILIVIGILASLFVAMRRGIVWDGSETRRTVDCSAVSGGKKTRTFCCSWNALSLQMTVSP